LSFECDAIQPQRTMIIEPTLYVTPRKKCSLEFNARVYSDSFPEPVLLSAQATFQVTKKKAPIGDVIPDWQKLAE